MASRSHLRHFKKIFFLFLALTTSAPGYAQSVGDYRTTGTGLVANWSVVANWQTWNGSAWVAAGAAPTSASGAITIQSQDYITIAATLTIDQVVVNPGARLRLGANQALTVANGTGVDLQVNGTFVDSSSTSITWNASSTWQMGSSGTLVRCRGTSAATGWQNNYQGGISSIPSTATWIIRKRDASNPIITTIGMYYPNLTIENYYTSAWTTATTSTFQGTTGFPTVLGNLDIGGSGSNTVDFLNGQTYSTASTVNGNVTIRAGNTLRNYGTGLQLGGNLTVNGTINYSGGTGSRNLIFNGSNAQSISGTGTLNIYNLTVNNISGGLTLNRAITVDNVLTFTSGIVYSTGTNLLTISSSGSVSGASNSSFVSGPVRYTGSSAFTFPVGKGSDYQALSMSSSTAANTFWTETFNNGCTSGCLASSYTGVNGTWTINNSNNPATDNCGQVPESNDWYVSCAENGNAVGSCGSGCGSNATLHLGSITVGDIGAAYDAGGYCDLLGPGWGGGTNTDKRCESPTINCTGYSNIILAFNYIENGQGSTDNATVWYYDGSTWSQIDDPPKTSTGCGGQGIWASRSLTLPSSANNNANVKIGFRWVNNDDGAGNDPSFAVNDITLTQPGPTVDFTCEYFYSNPQTPYGNTMVPSLAALSNCEYWILTRNAGSENKYVTLTWDGNSCGIVNALTDVRVARYDGVSTWQNEGNTSTTGSTATGTVTSGLVTSFSPFTLASITNIALPVSLLSFNAWWNGADVSLDWSTATETNNDFFTVERSADGVSFSEVLRVKGAGTSIATISYHSFDVSAPPGLVYYRLRQTDYDGNFSYSRIAVVEVPSKKQLSIRNVNCSSDEIDCYMAFAPPGYLKAELLDASGKIIYSFMAGAGDDGSIRFPAAGLSAGIYLVKISSGDAITTRKIQLIK